MGGPIGAGGAEGRPEGGRPYERCDGPVDDAEESFIRLKAFI